MSKDSSCSYTVYPEQGAFRIGNYFAGDAVLKVETYDGDTLKETMTVEPTVDRGFSSTLTTVYMAMTSVAMTKADMESQALSHISSGLCQPLAMNTAPSFISQACSMGFSYFSIKSG